MASYASNLPENIPRCQLKNDSHDTAVYRLPGGNVNT